MTRKTTRLYYGHDTESGKSLYWTIKVTNAKRPVKINGTVLEAMTGKPGLSIGCHLSNTVKTNKTAFPHPVIYASFTKSVCLVITKIARGQPVHCVRYRHNYSQYVNLNDKDPSKATVKAHPELFNRKFTLGAYKGGEPGHWKPEYGRRETGARAAIQMAKGERARFKAAGLVMAELTI